MKTNVVTVTFGRADEKYTKSIYQWNKGQILEFTDVPDGTEVQFFAGTLKKNKIVENGKVQIPDIMLEGIEMVSAFVVIVDDKSETTKKVVHIPIQPKPRPDDYVSSDDERTFREYVEEIMTATKEIAEEVYTKAENGEFNGQDGRTPIKGVDYYTDSDKEEITQDVVQRINLSDKVGAFVLDGNSEPTTNANNYPGAKLGDICVNKNYKVWICQYLYDNTIVWSELLTPTSSYLSNSYYSKNETDSKLETKTDKAELSGYVKDTDFAQNNGTPGIVKLNNGIYGIKNVENNIIGIISASNAEIEALTSKYRCITPKNLSKAVQTIGGLLDDLQTDDKSSYVGAVNELANNKADKADWKLITELDVTEPIGAVEVTTDSEGNPFAYDDIYVVATNVAGAGNWILSLKTTTDSSNANIISLLNANAVTSTPRHFFSKIKKMMGLSGYEYDLSYKNATAYTNTTHKGIGFAKYDFDETTKFNWIRIHFFSSNQINAGKIRIYGRNRR